MFRVLGDTLEIFPSSREMIYSLDFFDETLDRIRIREPLTNRILESVENIVVFPAKHFMTSRSMADEIIPKIRHELDERVAHFQHIGKLVEAERIKMRTEYDIEMLQETGYVSGIENYSLYMANRPLGTPPSTLIDFFPKDALCFVDESHISLPQIGGMYAGDRARKTNLIEYGFRLPSAYENRPLQFHEFEERVGQTLYISATPAKYEIEKSSVVAEQIIRPTGLLDPQIILEEMEYVADSLLGHIQKVCERGERALITTITKKSSEELAEFLAGNGVKVKYLHSEIDTIERLEILRDLRV